MVEHNPINYELGAKCLLLNNWNLALGKELAVGWERAQLVASILLPSFVEPKTKMLRTTLYAQMAHRKPLKSTPMVVTKELRQTLNDLAEEKHEKDSTRMKHHGQGVFQFRLFGKDAEIPETLPDLEVKKPSHGTPKSNSTAPSSSTMQPSSQTPSKPGSKAGSGAGQTGGRITKHPSK
ncbi:hypothetical protein L207DRAFT_592750 [Hyaloscypha variabilis F]|uniref:Uncharacterized protein n=1 Tax=Hyaloscypha variabilis (strain UAMH 11265 / GT02V1 / F) TaxID=1149755 RepID=A0A2J6QVJ3_HYAVF|nr:hypothetical protein L207DRAFT_592750 [Hyaloscypha variabilis F]